LSCELKYFFKFNSGVLFILDYYPQNFSWRQQCKFHLKRDWRKSKKFIICNGLVCFDSWIRSR